MLRRFLLILTLIISCFSPAKAWNLFGWHIFEKEPEDNITKYIREEIFINRVYKASDGLYKFDIAIFIPKGIDFMTVTVRYDQLEEKKIRDIAWVRGGAFISSTKRNVRNIFHSDKKPTISKIFPFKKEEFVKSDYEFDHKYNPHIAYQRADEQKHIVYKRYHFKQADIFNKSMFKQNIFGKALFKENHVLEFHFEDGTKKAINLKKDLYMRKHLRPEDKIITTKDVFYSHKPVLPSQTRDDARKVFNEYLRRENQVIKNKQENDYREAMKNIRAALENGDEMPDFEGLYRDN